MNRNVAVQLHPAICVFQSHEPRYCSEFLLTRLDFVHAIGTQLPQDSTREAVLRKVSEHNKQQHIVTYIQAGNHPSSPRVADVGPSKHQDLQRRAFQRPNLRF